MDDLIAFIATSLVAVSYTHLRAHETVLELVCRLLLEKINLQTPINFYTIINNLHQHHSVIPRIYQPFC